MTFEQNNPKTIGEATRLIQAQRSDLTFEQCWSLAEEVFPALVPSSSTESNQVTAPSTRRSWSDQAQIEAEARALMVKDPRLPFGVALIRARSEAGLAQAAHPQAVPAIKPKSRTMLIKGHNATYVD